MGFKLLDLNMPTGYAPQELERKIAKKLRLTEFTFAVEKKSLDARKKKDIRWNIRVGVTSKALPGPLPEAPPKLNLPFKKRSAKIIVVGSGPAGFFAAYTLLLAGFQVTLLEQGPEVEARARDILEFESSGQLNDKSNYAFGEGGAGTFSDGKLTSRTKSISAERAFVMDTYVKAGAPSEIAFLTHPHLGSDNLRQIVKNLRDLFRQKGGEFLFDTTVENITLKNNALQSVETDKGSRDAQYVVFAPGHSSYPTYRMLLKQKIPFRLKPFALGCRVEHSQASINTAQWGRTELPGVKAAEYRLTFKNTSCLPVYSFCMCPGGKVVPAAPAKGLNIVNGMSNYKRNSPFANAAVVAGVRIEQLFEREVEPLEAMEWLERLERRFYDFSGSYAAPACNIGDFIRGKVSGTFAESSYPFDLVPADFTRLLPEAVSLSLKEGLKNFCRKLEGFDRGIMLGLESKTSSPLQALRDKNGKCESVGNLYISGEGSGYAGGIISSAADGIKAAMDIIDRS